VRTHRLAAPFAAIVIALFVPSASVLAQWDPPNGEWGKSASTDVRVMTWNVEDAICSTNVKTDELNDWNAIVRIVAGLKPDVLILQETADNGGNGTGSGVDSVGTLATTLALFLYGGNDPFRSGNPPVTAWVRKYAPAYDLPHVFVSTGTDNFNRNVILSRFPFADLNGDGRSQLSDIPFVLTDLYAPGGGGGIRGFMFAEIDLPDGTYRGDLVVGCAHLKSGGTADDQSQRLLASQNVAYYLDYMFNGGGTPNPDPRSKIFDNPSATQILDAFTPWVIGGDWNEDELTNSRKGPAEWLTLAAVAGGADGTDRDRSDAAYDDAREPFSGNRGTRNSAKLDYIGWQDSIAVLRRAFVFNSSSVSPTTANPPELAGYPISPGLASGFASDHRPVVADFELPLTGVFAPDVTAVSPNAGALRGGDEVDVIGSSFDTVATVAFGGVPAQVVSRMGETRIRVRVPAGSAEGQVVGVAVTQPGGSDTLPSAFTYGANPIEVVWSGNPAIGGSVTFTVYGPANRKVGFILGPPGSFNKIGYTFCATPPFTIKRFPRDFNTGALGAASLVWTPAGSPMVTYNAQAVVRDAGMYVQTNCVSVTTR